MNNEKQTPRLNKAFAGAIVVFALAAIGVAAYAQNRSLELGELESMHNKASASISEMRNQLAQAEQELRCLESDIAAKKIEQELASDAPNTEEIKRLSDKLNCGLGK